MDDNGLTEAAFAYRWTRVNDNDTSADIADATSQSYALVEADQGTRVRVTVSFEDDDGNPEELSAFSLRDDRSRGQRPRPRVSR